MATTLMDYWTAEAARLAAAAGVHQAGVAALRLQLQAMQGAQAEAAGMATAQGKAVDAARKALAGIAMPADGDPLLAAMATALAGLAQARADQASSELQAQSMKAELALEESTLATLVAQARAAAATLLGETEAAALRATMAASLTTGALSTLAADATAALANKTKAANRVQGEFPAGATPAQSLLARVRARRGLVGDSARQAAAVDAAALAAGQSALAQARVAFDAAAAAVQATWLAPATLAADTTLLATLAALPLSNPILSVSEHARLNDPALEPAREAALSKLTDVDDAHVAVRAAQTVYDTALLAAIAADADATLDALNAGAVSGPYGDLQARIADAAAARGALSADELATLQQWFATVPDALWEALDGLDAAVVRLNALAGNPSPSDLVDRMAAAEAALVATLQADAAATLEAVGAHRAWQRADGIATAESATLVQRARAYGRSAALL